MDKGEIVKALESEQEKIEKFLYDNRMNNEQGMIIFNRGIKEYYHAMDLVKEYFIKGGDFI